MIILDMPQGSTEWIAARLWRLTASAMKNNITATGKLSKSEAAMKEIDKLIAGLELANVMLSRRDEIDRMDEWQLKQFMAHYTGEKFAGSVHTLRGKDCEADAIAAMSEIIGRQIHDVGMCVMGDDVNGVVSCSPDGLIYDADGKPIAGAEVKSPCLCNYFRHVMDGVLPDEYALQVHASMAITGLDTWHFGSYFAGKPLFYIDVKRNDFTEQIEESLIEFKQVYQKQYIEVMDRVGEMKGGQP